MEYTSNLALYLLDNTGSIFGTHSAKLTAAQQRTLFGRVLGKGTIVVSGLDETVCNRVKVCFGLDYDDRNVTKWSVL